MVPFLALFPAPAGSAVERIGDHILFNVRGERHSEERRVLGPPLHRRRLERWVAAIDAIAEQHVAALPRGAVIDAPAVLQTFTLEVILRIVFGVDAADRSRAAEAAAMRDFLTQVLDVLGDPSAALLPIDLPGFPYRRALHLLERFEREARRLATSSTADGLITDLSAPPREALTGASSGCSPPATRPATPPYAGPSRCSPSTRPCSPSSPKSCAPSALSPASTPSGPPPCSTP
jgi:cytochrome P450